MRKILFVSVCIPLVFALYLAYTMVDSDSPAAVAKKEMKTYSGIIYVAGMGGHFTEAEIEIDPALDKPIKVKELNRVDIGDKDTHPTHDTRIDVNNRTKMYWSTYKIDKNAEGRTVHVGISDLETGEVIKDKSHQLPERAKWPANLYCSSGQTENSYMPATMTNEGYISVFDKKTLDLKRHIYVDSLGYKNNYIFIHGTNSPDMKNYVLTVNKTKEWLKPDSPPPFLGQIDVILLELPALEKGEFKVITKNTITGSPAKTITFRQRFTPDGSYLLQSGADRFFLLKGDDMKLLDEEMMDYGENHDAVPTPDGKYAILTLRSDITHEGKKIKDGTVLLYDINARKAVGKPTSVCYTCHLDSQEDLEEEEKVPMWNAVLCGIEANWK